MSDETQGTATIKVESIPEGHVVVGYIVVNLKVLDENGDLYWALRRDGLDSMESYGMAHDLVDSIRRTLQGIAVFPNDDD